MTARLFTLAAIATIACSFLGGVLALGLAKAVDWL